MTKEEYLAHLKKLLDAAATDSSLSTEDYAAMCEEIAAEAGDRADMADTDLTDKIGDEG